MIITTTPNIEGRRITAYHGVVSGEAILGANAVIGIDLDYGAVGKDEGMMMVTASGTAVTVE